MSDQTQDGIGDVLPPQPDGELVHWMDSRPLSIGPAGVSITAGAAFTVGVVAAVAVLALLHWLGPERIIEVRRRARL
jgi:hypothetical protein